MCLICVALPLSLCFSCYFLKTLPKKNLRDFFPWGSSRNLLKPQIKVCKTTKKWSLKHICGTLGSKTGTVQVLPLAVESCNFSTSFMAVLHRWVVHSACSKNILNFIKLLKVANYVLLVLDNSMYFHPAHNVDSTALRRAI